MEVEDQVQLADVTEVLVEDLDEALHEFEDDEFVLVLVDDGDEVEGGVAFVDDFVLLEVEEIAHFGLAGDDHLVDLRPSAATSFSNRCFSYWVRLLEYHFVSRDRPCRLIRKKQWIMAFKYYKHQTHRFTNNIKNAPHRLPRRDLRAGFASTTSYSSSSTSLCFLFLPVVLFSSFFFGEGFFSSFAFFAFFGGYASFASLGDSGLR